MSHQSDGKIGVFGRIGKPGLEFRGAFHHDRVLAPPGYADDLRVGPGAVNDRRAMPGLRPADQLVDALHEGAGRIHDPDPARLQGQHRRAVYAVGADDHGALRWSLVHGRDLPDAHLREPLNHVPVVDDGAEGDDAAAFPGDPFDGLHRPLHAEAKARRVGYLDFVHKTLQGN